MPSMLDAEMTREELLQELEVLRARLTEPEETVEAIRSGEVDAFVVLEPDGEKVYTLGTGDLLRQLHLITESLPMLACYVDHERRYRFNNRRYEEWFGLPLHEITGRPVWDLMGAEAYEAVRDQIDEALAGRQVSFERWLNYPGTDSRCVCASLVPHIHAGEILGFVAFGEDVSERKRAEAAWRLLADAGKLLSESLEREDSLVEVARVAVPGFADWCAIDFVQAEGGSRRVVRVPSPSGPEVEESTPCTSEASLLADGSQLWVPLVARGRTLGVWSFGYTESGRRYRQDDLGVAQELARRVAVALDNSALYRALEAANRAKDHFLATLSHELRTPLTPVLAMASRLELQELPAGVRAGLAMIRRNVELEARLIDDLLDLTRISRGKLELHCATTDLRQVLEQALETLDERELASRQMVQDLAARDHTLFGDPSRLAQVFWNLLNNALKFTPPGGTIWMRTYAAAAPAAAERQPAAGELVVEISDSGVGIEPEALAGIFDAFNQGGPGIARRFGGLGLGLAISRAIVEQHGGSLTAASEGRDLGARFVVKLPVANPAGAVAGQGDGEAVATSPETAKRPLHILVVEDHGDTAEAIALLLHSIGHRVTAVPTAAAALAAAECQPFDIVVSDLGLPDGDGYELMRVLAGRHRQLRGIALSGYGTEEDSARSREAGFHLHLVKPVAMNVLQDAIQRVAGPAAS